MINGKKVLAVIAARGGSKRLPGKNIKKFHGKPLILWTIDAALKCKYIDKVVVNSDAEEILAVGNVPGVVIDKRSENLATDTSTSIDVALDVLKRFNGFDVLVWLQATSPLRTEVHIEQAIKDFSTYKATSLTSVTEEEHSPYWLNQIDDNGKLRSVYSTDMVNKRSQDFEKFYRLNGAIYVNDVEDLSENKKFILSNTYAYLMEKEFSVDIDTSFDFEFAEFLYKRRFF